jgi:hypothetical protein
MAMTNDQLRTALRDLIDALQTAIQAAQASSEPSYIHSVLSRLSSDLRNISTYEGRLSQAGRPSA